MNSPSRAWPWAVCGVLLLATLLNYMDRQALAVTLPTLKPMFHLGESRIGKLEGWFGFSFAFGSLFFGWLADRTGPRFLYPAVLTGWSLAGIATALAGQSWVATLLEKPGDAPGTGIFRWLLVCRCALGAFEAGHWPCALLTVRAILTAKHRTLGNGILQSGASIGALLVPIYIEAGDYLGFSWRFPFWSIGLVGLAWVPLWFFLMGNRDLSSRKSLESAISTALSHESDGLLSLIRRLIVLALIVATLTISWQFLRAWLPLFLQDHHGYSKRATRWTSVGYFAAADIGCMLSGVLVSGLAHRGWRIHSAQVIGFAIFTMLTACGALVPFVGTPAVMIALLLITGAGILGLHPYYYAFTQEISAKNMGLLSGLLSAFGWVISSLSQIYLGRHIEATKSYQMGLVMVGLAPVVGLTALLVLWPRETKAPSMA